MKHLMVTPIKVKNDSSSLDQIKKIPITSLYKGTLKNANGLLKGSCPFHEDSSPSFFIYPATNSFNCFGGCGGGSVIDFYMKLHGVDFKAAVEALKI